MWSAMKTFSEMACDLWNSKQCACCYDKCWKFRFELVNKIYEENIEARNCVFNTKSINNCADSLMEMDGFNQSKQIEASSYAILLCNGYAANVFFFVCKTNNDDEQMTQNASGEEEKEQ